VGYREGGHDCGLDQSALRLRGARKQKKQVKDAFSDAQDELQKTQRDNIELEEGLLALNKTLLDARAECDATNTILYEHMQRCPQNGDAEQARERTKALREALAHELADEAYTMDDDNGTTQFIITVRITIRARDSEMVASNGKWREVRRNAKKIMLSWYKKAVQDTGARDYLELEMEGWLDHDEEDVVLQRRRGV
jgi:chromosome segregation ATPase